jgi:hypothetical protein
MSHNENVPARVASERKPYSSPVLKRQGTIAELTRTTNINLIVTDGPGNYS